MPLFSGSTYVPPPLLRGPHCQTIYAGRFRRVAGPRYDRIRLDTPDDDFLDVDRALVGASRVAVLSHGLEGNSGRGYVRGMARALNAAGWDVLAWNYRTCGGTLNRRLRAYHSGATDDLDVVVRYALAQGYRTLALVGFSLGGNLTLKYVGERGAGLPGAVAAAVAFSTPCDLAAGAAELAKPKNRLYRWAFLRSLRAKARLKAARHPGCVDVRRLAEVRTLYDFDDGFTAPIHGFRDADDYYRRCSALRFLDGIRIPTLLVNAADDPFLAGACYPVAVARRHRYLTLEVPAHGGHVGFVRFGPTYWSEARAVAFLAAVA